MSSPPNSTSRGRAERSLAGAFLRQAAEQLEAAGSAPHLYAAFVRGKEEPTQTALAVAEVQARMRRLDALRSSVLFSALAAEAYVNEFLSAYLRGKDFDAVERMSTVNKYVLGTRLAARKPLFIRSKAPMTGIAALFKLRDKSDWPRAE